MLVRLALFLLASLAVASRVDACDCPLLPPCQTFWSADAVFIGSVVRTADQSSGTVVKVDEWLRREGARSEVTIAMAGDLGMCNYSFKRGERYLVHATKSASGTWAASLCGGTIALQQAAEPLAYIRDALARPGPGRLSGSAFVDIDPDEKFVRSGPVLSGVRLFLRGAAGERTTRADSNGDYSFTDVPAGDYTLLVELPADYVPVPPKRIGIGRGSCVRHVFWTTWR